MVCIQILRHIYNIDIVLTQFETRVPFSEKDKIVFKFSSIGCYMVSI